MIKKKDKGFTLVELVVTMAIIAILAAVVVPTSIHFVNQADDEKKAAVLNDYMSRLIEVAQRQDSSGKLKPNDLICTNNLISLIKDGNKDIDGGYNVVGVLNDTATDYNTDPNYKDNEEFDILRSSEAFTVCFFVEEIDGKDWWIFRLKFYKNGKYKNIYNEVKYRAA